MGNVNAMNKRPPRYSLNAKQVHILKLLYKFRFLTASLLARYKGISRIASNKALKILLDQKYIGQHFDKSYRLQGKGPSYYLTPKALHLLKETNELNENVVHAMYKNKSVGQAFIDHNLAVCSAYLTLRNSYPDTFHIFTKTELADYNYFPEPHPDLYLNRIKPAEKASNEYVLDIFTDTQLFVIKKRIDSYIEHFDSGDWEAEAETDYPAILIACPDSRSEEAVQKHTMKILDNTGIDDLKVYTTTTKALIESNEATKAIWSSVQEPEKLLIL